MTTETIDAALAVSASDFMAALLQGAQRGEVAWIADFPGDPGGPAAAWAGRAYSAAIDPPLLNAGTGNKYACVGGLVRGADNKVARRKANFARAFALVGDDCAAESLLAEPTAIVQTSPGSSQVWFFLDADDRDARDVELVSRVLARMAEAGLGTPDPSGNSVTRYARIPGGYNHKPRPSGPYRVHCTHWSPDRRMSLAEAAAAFGIDLEEVRQAKLDRQPGGMLVSGEQDERMRVLTRNILGGVALHESINVLAASLVASGTQGGAAVNLLRALMDSSIAPRDDRWQQRYADIPRSVATAQDKFRAALPPPSPMAQEEPLFAPAWALLGQVKQIRWVVHGYIERDALVMIFGPSGAGKSFVVVDLACCVATGSHWHGKKVAQGAVFVVAGEGQNGITRRLAAWNRVHGTRHPITKSTPLYVSGHAVGLLNQDEADKMMAEIERMAQESGQAPAMVVIDTVARNFGAGDENSQQDASAFIAACDRIRLKWECTVIIVHHSGHTADRARGSSVFKAAMDQEISIKPAHGRLELEVTKMKDAEVPEGRSFAIEQVGLGVLDEDGQEIVGAALKPGGNPLDYVVGKPRKHPEIRASDVCHAIKDQWPGRPALAAQFQCNDKMIQRIVSEMTEAGWLEAIPGVLWGVRMTERALQTLSVRGAEIGVKVAE